MERDESEMINNEDHSEIRFSIQDYDDIFSDFDPRPVSQRGLSEDFLSEAKKASIVKGRDKVDFIFLVPRSKRDLKKESRIRDRLNKYFKRHLELLGVEKSKLVRQGVFFTVFGTILMLIATFLFFKFQSRNLIASFFTVFLEPASWFLFWEGLGMLVFEVKKVNPNIHFHKKMAKANIQFVSA